MAQNSVTSPQECDDALDGAGKGARQDTAPKMGGGQ